MEEDYINAMSHLALCKIYSHLEENELSLEHHEKLERMGGDESVDNAWAEALDAALRNLNDTKN